MAYCVDYVVEGPAQLAGAVQDGLSYHLSDGTCGILRHLQWYTPSDIHSVHPHSSIP